MGEIEILVPVADARVVEHPLAARPRSLAGLRVGLVENQKANAASLIAEVGADLARRAGPFEAVHAQKPATAGSSVEVLAELRTCHAVVLAIAD